MLIVDVCLGVGYAILGEAGLSYFGYGVQAPDTSLGTLISEGAKSTTIAPWIFLAPASVLVLLVMCVNALGDGLRDALDPSSLSGGHACPPRVRPSGTDRLSPEPLASASGTCT